ncbi:MAG: IPT/TIG domain-containing protein [Actinobacteria bacterium]|nr:IPT/TIG domain-containing protein [Actinomycetota bacterium]MBU1945236.1 IPT/TIG domain-containing protein [Actinomycetota bacterium]MBU2687808.1 IPT/TIG domain-containing protein [Actinomycetota bacterium]
MTIEPLSGYDLTEDSTVIDATGHTVVIDCSGIPPAEADHCVGLFSDGNTLRALRIINMPSGDPYQGIAVRIGNSSANSVAGCLLGTPDGLTPAPNGHGIVVDGGNNNTVGGPGASDRNLICSSETEGIRLQDTSANVIAGNYIGVGADGQTDMANVSSGVRVVGGSANTIGAGNVISGGPCIYLQDSECTRVIGNRIGTNASGDATIAPYPFAERLGIVIMGTGSAQVGGAAAGDGNLISGFMYGIWIMEGSGGHSIKGNYIGTDVTGTVPLGIGSHGILIQGSGNQVGGSTLEERNIISCCTSASVCTYTPGTGNRIEGNYVGTDVTGQAAFGDNWVGIGAYSGGNTIGGDSPGEGNLVSGCDVGVLLNTSNSTGNTVSGNRIGTDRDGLTAIPNTYGVALFYAGGNTIGGDSAQERNLISGNGYGVLIGGGDGNTISGNYIGVQGDGTGVLPDQQYGVLVSGDSSDNLIGGYGPSEANVVAGQTLCGIQITGEEDDPASGNTIEANRIGVDLAGAPAPNLSGIIMGDYAQGNSIGGPGPLANTIGSNSGAGVIVEGTGSFGNAISGNSFRENGGLAIDLIPDAGPNAPQASYPYPTADQPNLWMNFPDISIAEEVAGGTRVSGTALPDSLLEIYRADPDPTGYGEGAELISQTVCGPSGDFEVTGLALPSGQSVTATATDSEGNTSEFSQSVTVADRLPPSGSISINAGAGSTTSREVTLSLTVSDNLSPDQDCAMLLSNYPDFPDAGWVPFEQTRSWELLAGGGTRTVYAMFRDEAGNESEVYQDAIELQEPVIEIPVLTSVTPAKARMGTAVTVRGEYLGTPTPEYKLYIGGKQAREINAWSASEMVAIIPEGARTGTVFLRSPAGDSNKLDITILSTWYFAEGCIGGTQGFEEYISIQNMEKPEEGSFEEPSARLAIEFFPAGKQPVVLDFDLPPYNQLTVDVAGYLEYRGVYNRAEHTGIPLDVSVRVTSKSGVDISCSRAVWWNSQGERHASPGVMVPRKTWYFAEACGAWGFETYLLLFNPNAVSQDVSVGLLDGNPQTKAFAVPPRTRVTVDLEREFGPVEAALSLTSDLPFVCERSMYWDAFQGGHNSLGQSEPFRQWYFAEGSTAWGFEEWLLLGNPGSQPAQVDIFAYTETGMAPLTSLTVPAGGRTTLRVNDCIPGSNVSLEVSANAPLIAERSMYWNKAGYRAGHSSAGVRSAGAEVWFPDGDCTDGGDSYLLLFNPTQYDWTVKVSGFMPMRALVMSEYVGVPAFRRVTVDLNKFGKDGYCNVRYSIFSLRVLKNSSGSPSVISEMCVYSPGMSGGSAHHGAIW